MSQPLRPAGESTTPTVAASDALEGLAIAPGGQFGDARLSSVVATTLRAALDLVLGGGSPLRPLTVSADDAALEIRSPISHPEALELSGGLLESIEGSLTRAGGGRPEWVFRVPLSTPRSMFLMLAQGTLGLAVPWHAVMRVRLVPPGAVHATARREGAAVIPAFVSAADNVAERPVVLLALGLKRAFLVADRLIWRMPADPIEDLDGQGGPSLTRAVRTADGEVFWVVDPADLMRDIAFELPDSATIAAPPAPVPPASPAQVPSRRPASAPGTRPGAARWERPVLQLIELRAEDVEPIGPETNLEDAAAAPAEIVPPSAPASTLATTEIPPPPAPASTEAPAEIPPLSASTSSLAPAEITPPAAPTWSPAPAEIPSPSAPPPVQAPAPVPVQALPAPAFRRALIAEDSIVGRIFLARLLERRGFVVEMVTRASELQAALESGPWNLVMADVELPDSSRGEHLRQLSSASSAVWIALVRDRDDEALALAAGVQHHLRKPFEVEALDRLLPDPGQAGSAS